jgi:hypothetical protein
MTAAGSGVRGSLIEAVDEQSAATVAGPAF